MNKKSNLQEIAWRNIKGQLFTLEQVINFPDAYFNNIYNLYKRGGNRSFFIEYPNASSLIENEYKRRLSVVTILQ